MVRKVRAWLGEWELNPHLLPHVSVFLAFGGVFMVVAVLMEARGPVEYSAIAVGVACVIGGLRIQRRLKPDDREVVAFIWKLLPVVLINQWIESKLSPNGDVHWLYRWSLWTCLFLLVDFVWKGVPKAFTQLLRRLQSSNGEQSQTP